MRRDSKLRGFGETDDRTRVTKINVKASKEYGKHHKDWATRGGVVANTIEHELIHQKHNDMTEKEVRKETDRHMKSMPKERKNKLYSLLK